MGNYLKKFIGDKKVWRSMEARAKVLPGDYKNAYREIQRYMWKFSGGDGMDLIAIFEDLLGLFEEGVANGKEVLEITGDDVAAFCDELLRNANTYMEKWRQTLNRNVRKKFGSEEK